MAHFLTDNQFRTLTAMCEALTPPVEHTPDPHGFWRRTASDLDVPRQVTQVVRDLHPDQHHLFRLFLNLLQQPLTAGLLTGHFRAFADLPLATREKVLQAWAVSWSGGLRQAFQSVKRLALFFFYASVDASGVNPNWPAINYPGPFNPPSSQPKTLKPLTISADTTLDCDVVVIGSGAGGSVVAEELAQAGKHVIILEKGGYYNERDFVGSEYEGFRNFYELQGTLTSRDLGVVVVAGSVLGGGTLINWSAMFRTPPFILEEWEREHGLLGFTGAEYQRSLEAVVQRLHVDEDESHLNPANAALMRGCQALGYHVALIARNVHGCGDCGACGFGCSSGAKQSGLKTYLQDAADHGAQIVVRCAVDKVNVEAGQATGVEATCLDAEGQRYTLKVRAKAIVVAAGSLHSPALLLRSGIVNSNLGANLHLHITGAAWASYAEKIETWRGVMMAAYSDEFGNLDGRGYGFKIETPPVHPGFIAQGIQWLSGRQHREVMLNAAHNGALIVLLRDRDAGRVRLDRRGQPTIDYRISNYDARHMLRGLQEALRIQAAAGAHTVSTVHSGLAPLDVRTAGPRGLEAYLAQVERRGLRVNECTLYSAHQMGTCRMGGRRSQSVVDPNGESWDVRRLFLADASTFPTPSGVNPMLTIMAVAHRVAQYVKTRV